MMSAPDGKALFLSGLSELCEFTDLHDFFGSFGKIVLCRVLKDAKTGRSRRVGYVNFERAEDATRAMLKLNGQPGPGGAPFDIKIASHDPGFKAVETRKLFVRYVPVTVTEPEVRAAFSQFGAIEECIVSRDVSRTARREPGPWNMAYVTYADPKDAIAAVASAAATVRFGDQPLTVKPAVSEETLRMRTKTRQAQQAQEHAAQQAQRRAAAAAAASLTAPPGLVPVFIPGVGTAFLPAAAAAQQQQQPQQQPQQMMQQQQQQPVQFQQLQQLPQPMYQPMQQPLQQQQPTAAYFNTNNTNNGNSNPIMMPPQSYQQAPQMPPFLAQQHLQLQPTTLPWFPAPASALESSGSGHNTPPQRAGSALPQPQPQPLFMPAGFGNQGGMMMPHGVQLVPLSQSQ